MKVKARGYSLIELAIVLVVLSLLLGGMLAGFGIYKDRAEELSNQPVTEEEYDTLIYELKTGKPCPKKGLTKGNGKKVGLLKFCPDTAT